MNAEKCTFRMTKVVFMGLLLTRHGIGPTKEKVRAVVEASQPQSPSGVHSFSGLVGFSARFIPYFSTTVDPLRKIARQGESFIWGEKEEKSLQKLKRHIAGAPVLAYFDKEAHFQIIVDASPVGLGAVLIQERNGERCAVCYASRTLSNVEHRYSQTEKEALALVWACECFISMCMDYPNLTLLLIMKHLNIFMRESLNHQPRLSVWVLRLQPYNNHVCYVSSRKNIADALSRLKKIVASNQSQDDDEYIRTVALPAAPAALKIKETEQDPELQAIKRCLVKANKDCCFKPVPR